MARVPPVEHCVSFANCQWPPEGEDKMASGGEGAPPRPNSVRIVSWNANGLREERKRREVVEIFKSSRIDVMGIQETHVKGSGMTDCRRGNECMMWEGLEGGVVWSGMAVDSKGRGREGCALLLSPRVWEGIEDQGWEGSRIVWATGKVGIVKYAWVCVYAPVNARSGKGREEMRKFWYNLNECLRRFERGRKIVLMGDMNGRVGSSEVAGVVGKWGVEGVNENGEHLVDMCAERGLFLANTCFEHRLIHRYTWRRGDGRDEQKSLIDYIAVDDRLRKDVMDAKVVRGMCEGSDHYAVLAKMRVRGTWEYGRSSDRREVRVLASGKLERKEVREEYERKVGVRLREASVSVREETSVNEVFSVFKEVVMSVAAEVVGHKVLKGRRGGSAWWTDEIKEAVDEKRRAYKRVLQKNVTVEVRESRKAEYRFWKRKVKELVNDSKQRVDEDFGRKLSEDFNVNKKLFWREVKRERGGSETRSVRVKNEDGSLVGGREEVTGVWKRHFERLMSERTVGEAVVTSMGMEAGGKRVCVQRDVERVEVEKAISRLKCGKAAGIDGITPEMLKYGGEVVVEWMWLICKLAWKQKEVPEEWRKAVIVPLYKGKGSKSECNSYRGISMLSVPGKVYGRILTERLMKVTEGKVSEEQGGFRKGKGCVDQIFAIRMIVEEYLAKGRKLYAAFMDLEKAYDRVDREALWNVLRIYGVGGQLLDGIKAFYREASACVRVDGELSESFDIGMGVRQGCVMSPWLFNVFMDGCMREMKAKVGNAGAKLRMNDVDWPVVGCLFADDTVLLAESERELQRVVDEFHRVCTRRKLRVNAGKSKVIVFERRQVEALQFSTPYRVNVPVAENCEIILGGEKMEVVKEFKYLGTVLCKHGEMDGEIRARAVKGRSAIGALDRIMKGRNVSMEVKRGLRNSILLPTLTYGSETWTWNSAQQSRLRAVEMSYLRGACGVTRWDGLSNESVYERCGMSHCANGVQCGAVEWVKRNTLRWYGHMERMKNEEFVKKVYMSELEGTGRRGRPLGRWKDRVKEYLNERGVRGVRGLEQARRECMDRERWRLFCRGHPLGGCSRRERGVRAIDR